MIKKILGGILLDHIGVRCIFRWHRTICTGIQSHHYGWFYVTEIYRLENIIIRKHMDCLSLITDLGKQNQRIYNVRKSECIIETEYVNDGGKHND